MSLVLTLYLDCKLEENRKEGKRKGKKGKERKEIGGVRREGAPCLFKKGE